MLVKLNNTHYINTDHIVAVSPSLLCRLGLNSRYHINLVGRFRVTVSQYIAAYVIAFMEPNEGLLDESLTTNQPQPQLSLPSRIAIFVKDHPEGVQLYDLQEQFPHELDDELAKAINTLLRENVLITDGFVYQHKATAGSATALISDTPPDTW